MKCLSRKNRGKTKIIKEVCRTALLTHKVTARQMFENEAFSWTFKNISSLLSRTMLESSRTIATILLYTSQPRCGVSSINLATTQKKSSSSCSVSPPKATLLNHRTSTKNSRRYQLYIPLKKWRWLNSIFEKKWLGRARRFSETIYWILGGSNIRNSLEVIFSNFWKS